MGENGEPRLEDFFADRERVVNDGFHLIAGDEAPKRQDYSLPPYYSGVSAFFEQAWLDGDDEYLKGIQSVDSDFPDSPSI